LFLVALLSHEPASKKLQADVLEARCGKRDRKIPDVQPDRKAVKQTEIPMFNSKRYMTPIEKTHMEETKGLLLTIAVVALLVGVSLIGIAFLF
jgi:hypothetical protein